MLIRIFIFTLLLPHLSFAQKPKITTSSEPIAAITRMLVGDNAMINTISNSSLCPHEYILKPSDLNLAKNSDFVIYLSDYFEPFILPVIKNSHAKVINLSERLKFNPKSNMHIWMSLEDVHKMAVIIADELNVPHNDAVQRIDQLNKYKKTQLADLRSVLLLSDSLEYLFEDMPHVKIEKLYIMPGMTSVRDIVTLRNQPKDRCILMNNSDNIASISSKIGHKVIPVSSESWSIEGYKKIIDDIRSECL